MTTSVPAAVAASHAPPAAERSLAEIKAEVMRRAGRINPFEGIRREDAERIVDALTSLDRDHWAACWCEVGLGYEAQADARARAGASDGELAALYTLAFEYCHVGRYPVPSTPGKEAAYRHSLRLFRKAARHFEPALQVVEIAFEGKTLVGYLQLPPGVARPPVVMHWGGVDGWKENRQRASALFLRAGIASLTVDMPGAGENPVRYGDPGAALASEASGQRGDSLKVRAPDTRPEAGLVGARAERTFSAWLDHLARRSDLDGGRVGVWGGSFGAYWAARLAFVEANRIKGAVFHGGNVHYGFQEKWLVPAFTTGGATYLFGPASLLEARGRAMGTTTLEEFLAAVPGLSLLDMGLLDVPSAPILGVNGKLDDQAPVEDIYLLMEHGNPKEARIYPRGHHMGRGPDTPEDEIRAMIVGWLKEKLGK